LSLQVWHPKSFTNLGEHDLVFCIELRTVER